MQVETVDHKIFKLSEKAIATSSVIEVAFQEYKNEVAVPIPYHSSIVQWIVEYMELLSDLPPVQRQLVTPLKSPDMRFAVSSKQYEFLQRFLTSLSKNWMDQYKDVMSMALALDVDPLVGLLCAQLAAWIKGQNVQSSELLLRGLHSLPLPPPPWPFFLIFHLERRNKKEHIK